MYAPPSWILEILAASSPISPRKMLEWSDALPSLKNVSPVLSLPTLMSSTLAARFSLPSNVVSVTRLNVPEV